jgi:hypothetical protein
VTLRRSLPYDLRLQGLCHARMINPLSPVVNVAVMKDALVKPCRKCGETDRYKSGGCRPCGRTKRYRWVERNPEKAKAQAKKWWKKAKSGGRLSCPKEGWTQEIFEKKLIEQNNRCAICQRPFSSLKRRPDRDHNHRTKKARSLLCGRCNTAIGILESPLFPEYLAYLKAWTE